jgi:hypothetical protein
MPGTVYIRNKGVHNLGYATEGRYLYAPPLHMYHACVCVCPYLSAGCWRLRRRTSLLQRQSHPHGHLLRRIKQLRLTSKSPRGTRERRPTNETCVWRLGRGSDLPSSDGDVPRHDSCNCSRERAAMSLDSGCVTTVHAVSAAVAPSEKLSDTQESCRSGSQSWRVS